MQLLALLREQNDQMMHLAGRTWTPPPREMPIDEETEEQKEERILREQGWINF